MNEALRGVGVSSGVAAGPVFSMGRVPALPDPRQVSSAESELQAAQECLRALSAELSGRAATAAESARAIIEAQALMAADPLLLEGVEAGVKAGMDAVHAVHSAFTEQAEMLREAGGYLGERAADLEDLRARAVARLLGLPMPGIPDPGEPFVLAADDLAPVDTATLDPARVLALVTARGGPTSHTAILARALGIPAVVACRDVLGIPEGTVVEVDGTSGAVLVGVPRRERLAAPDKPRFTGPGRTADGHPVPLLLNIGAAPDTSADAEGVGLFRTELLFLGRHDEPAEDEQRAAYVRVFEAFPGRKVVVRTLDAGADKPLPFLGLAEEPNPALGIRGLRTSRQQPGVLETQLAAIAVAASRTDAEVWVMAPMVSTPAEAAEFASRARAHGLPTVGAMIEVPAAALAAREILEHVDFLSVGTNDLGQYTMAADRQCGDLADLLDPWQPALLRLVAECGRAGREAGKPVGVCGEAAADPLLAAVLVGLGVTSLSMSAGAVAGVGSLLGGVTLADCERAAQSVLRAGDPAQARALAGAVLA